MLSSSEKSDLLQTLRDRFEANANRHREKRWPDIEKRITSDAKTLEILFRMESSGGEPDVVDGIGGIDQIVFVDCATESPAGRRSLCYDRKALDARKLNKPANSVTDMAVDMGIEILSESEYRTLQGFGEFDLKTSSWIATPDAIRTRGGALFCDRRYDAVFVYHNGADSYYAARGFRGKLLL